MKIVSGYQDTRVNGEDLAVTPYIFAVSVRGKSIKVFGLGLCWIYGSFYLGIASGLPAEYPTFSKTTETLNK